MIYFVGIVEVPYQGDCPIVRVEAGGPTDAILKASREFNGRYGGGAVVLATRATRYSGYEGDIYIPERPRPLVYYRVFLPHEMVPRAPKELDPEWWPYGSVPQHVAERIFGRSMAARKTEKYRSLGEAEDAA